MGTKERMPQNTEAQSEAATVKGWIADLEVEIRKTEDQLKFGPRQGIDTVSLKQLSEELKGLKQTKQEYEELLGEAEKNK